MAASAAGISRGRLVSLAVLVAFLLGATWVVGAFRVARAVGRCLAGEGSVWADDECRHMMTYPFAVAVISLLLMLSLCCREAQAEAKVREDAILVRELGFLVAPESHHLRECNATAVVAIVIYMHCVLIMALGFVVRYAGIRRLLHDAADKGAYALAKAGTIMANVGCVTFWIECCCLIIPYMVLRFRRFVRENWVRVPSN
ncbi:hypothetical protein ACP70R_046274 [Stipagrostis hirtigluma subsp. patula]